MSVDTTTTNLKSIPLFADLEDSKLEDFQQIFQCVSFAPGARLMTQGQVADTIFFLESGTVEVVVTLPGGGEKVISTLGPGSVIGEMALFDEVGTRTATVRAVTPTTGFVVERQDCRVLLTQSQSTTFAVQRRITLSLCQRLRDLLTMVMNFRSPQSFPPSLLSTEPGPGSHIGPHTELPYAYKKILSQLPFFQFFRADEVTSVLEQSAVLQLPRGQSLFQQGSAGHASYIVVRGAIELFCYMASPYALGVVGPGQICGHIALLDEAPYETTAITRSESILLELSPSSFNQFFTGSSRLAAKFRNALLQNLLILQARIDNHLARMISQASIRA